VPVRGRWWRSRRVLVVPLVLALVAGGVTAGTRLLRTAPATGAVVIVATQSGGSGAVLDALELRARGRSEPVPVPRTVLPQSPGQTKVGTVRIATGTYSSVAARIGGRTMTAPLSAVIADAGLTPLLVVVEGGGLRAYAGNEGLNLGLQLASGQALVPSDITFTDQTGRQLSLTSLRGRVVVMAALETRCHDSCPVTTALFQDLERTLRARGLSDHVTLAEITMDPDRDTPEALAAYGRRTGADWLLLTAPPEPLRAFWSSLHATYEKVPYDGEPPTDWFTGAPETYDLRHDSLAVVIDGGGAARFLLQGEPRLGHSLPPPLAGLRTGTPDPAAPGSWALGDLLGRVDLLLNLPGEDTRGPEAAAEVGSPAPEIKLAGLSGDPVSLSDQLGRPVIVNFWATWCVPCRQELPLLAGAVRDHPNLVALAVDEGEDAATVRSFLGDVLGDRQPLTALLDGRSEVGQRYAVGGLPVSVFVDAGGTVRMLAIGRLDAGRLAAGLAAINA